MDLYSRCCVLTILLVCATLMLLLTDSAQGNGICTKNELLPRTKFVTKTFLQTYIKKDKKCPFYFGLNTMYYPGDPQCILQRTARTFKLETFGKLETIRFCCAGYKKGTQSISLTCEPVCDPPCLNSRCVAPDKCECNPGFVKRSGTDNICEPVCSSPCENGFCSSPETCTCHAGYHLSPSRRYSCEPVCSSPCANGYCSSPDVCTCHPGYNKNTTDDSQQCVAHCSTPCENAVCAAPEECACVDGYNKDNNTNTCLPVCEHECTNAVCTGPNLCTCFDGFILLEGHYDSCEPVCSVECHNAFCSAPGQCTCYPEYEINTADISQCKPVCSKECVNANCTAPNVCECLSGFEQTNDPSICKPYCSRGCENAICTEPEVCTCLWGYKQDGNSSGCPTESENHECSFVDKQIEYLHDETCLFVTDELKIEELSKCKILQEMLSKHQIDDDVDKEYLSLKCGSVSLFTVSNHSLELGIVCVVVLGGHTQFFRTTDMSTEQAQYFATNDDNFSTADYNIVPSSVTYTFKELTSSSVYEEIFQPSVNPVEKNTIVTMKDGPEEISTQSKFKIVFGKSTGDVSTLNTRHIPLNLNVTLQFLPVILQRTITQTYFDQNNTTLEQDWCLCYKSIPRKLCANQTTEMYICPCTASDFEEQVTGDSTTLFRATMKTLAFFSLVASLIL